MTVKNPKWGDVVYDFKLITFIVHSEAWDVVFRKHGKDWEKEENSDTELVKIRYSVESFIEWKKAGYLEFHPQSPNVSILPEGLFVL